MIPPHLVILFNSSTYGKCLLRISRNVAPTCVVSRLRSNHSKIARRCSSLPNERPWNPPKYLATAFSSLGGISSNVRGPRVRTLMGWAALDSYDGEEQATLPLSHPQRQHAPVEWRDASALFMMLLSSRPIRRMPQPRRVYVVDSLGNHWAFDLDDPDNAVGDCIPSDAARITPRRAGILHIIAEWQIGVSCPDGRNERSPMVKEISVIGR